MVVINEEPPGDPERTKALLTPGPESPIYMVNLLKFKDRAEYEDGRATELNDRLAIESAALKPGGITAESSTHSVNAAPGKE